MPAGAAGNQRGECQHAPLAVVVGAHDDGDVLDRDDQHERVDDERQHAEDVLVRRRDSMSAEEALPHRIQRARADVAVDDAESGQRQRQQAAVIGKNSG